MTIESSDPLVVIVDIGMIEAAGLTSREVERRRLLAADLSQFPPSERALDAAIEAFDLEFARLFDSAYADGLARSDAQMSALACAVDAYLREMGRS